MKYLVLLVMLAACGQETETVDNRCQTCVGGVIETPKTQEQQQEQNVIIINKITKGEAVQGESGSDGIDGTDGSDGKSVKVVTNTYEINKHKEMTVCDMKIKFNGCKFYLEDGAVLLNNQSYVVDNCMIGFTVKRKVGIVKTIQFVEE